MNQKDKMDNQTFIKYRIVFKVSPCVHCRILSFIARMNSKLPPEKQVREIDCTMYQRYGIVTDPLQILFSKMFDGFPCAFIDGIKISGTANNIESYEQFLSLLGEDFTIPEESEHKFKNECEFKKEGLFRGKVICQ